MALGCDGIARNGQLRSVPGPGLGYWFRGFGHGRGNSHKLHRRNRDHSLKLLVKNNKRKKRYPFHQHKEELRAEWERHMEVAAIPEGEPLHRLRKQHTGKGNYSNLEKIKWGRLLKD